MMGAVLGFLPFIAFGVVESAVGMAGGLTAATCAALALLSRDRISGETSAGFLEAGSAMLFCSLSIVALAVRDRPWSPWELRCAVDTGLLGLVVLGMVLHRPFTIPHAPGHGVRPEDRRAYTRPSSLDVCVAWAAAFALLVAVDLWMIFTPGIDGWRANAGRLTAIAAAAAFTVWRARHLQRHLAAE